MIYNKSAHPVEIKKISIRLWTVRDEIEAAIERRIKECEAAGVPLYIDDIKKFYNLNPDTKLTEDSNVLQMRGKEDGTTALMESLAAETKEEEKAEAAAPGAAASSTFNQAEEIIAEQKSQGLETKKPNPILDRPYQRQAPNSNRVSYGFTLLSDINMDNILSFIKDRFLQGQSVVVEFLIPQSFMMTAEVNYCNHYARTSKIISSTKPDYRVQCKFNYAISGEREALRNFLKSVEPNLAALKKKQAKSAEDDSPGL